MLIVPLVLGGCTELAIGWVAEAEGLVADEAGVPRAGAAVSIATAEGGWLADTVTGEEGRWRVPVLLTGTDPLDVLLVARATGAADAWTWGQVGLRDPPPPEPLVAGPGQRLDGLPWTTSPAILVEEGEGTARLRVLDALDGAPLGATLLELRAGAGTPADREVDAWGFTDGDGVAEVGLAAGVYTVRVPSVEGALPACGLVQVPAGGTGEAMLVVPRADAGELWASLTWSAGAVDLHLSGQRAGSSDPFYRYQVHPDAPRHPGEGDLVAEVTLDGEGVQAVRVLAVRDEGPYRVSALAAEGTVADTGAVLALSTPEGCWLDRPEPGRPDALWRGLEWEPSDGTVRLLQDYEAWADPDDLAAF